MSCLSCGKKSDKYIQKLSCLIVPAMSGKTSLCKEMENYKPATGKIIFIDIDQFVVEDDEKVRHIAPFLNDNKQKEIKLFPLAKGKIDQILKTHEDMHVVIITSNCNLPNFLKIDPEKTSAFIPSLSIIRPVLDSVTSGLVSDFKDTSEIILKTFIKSREDVMDKHHGRLICYESISEFTSHVVQRFSLIKNLIR